MKVVYFSLLLLSGNAIRNSLFQHRRTFTYQPANGVDKKTALFGYMVGMADDNLSLIASSPGQINSDGSNQGGIWKCVISEAAGLCPLMSPNIGVGTSSNTTPFMSHLIGVENLRKETTDVTTCLKAQSGERSEITNCYCCSGTSTNLCSPVMCFIVQNGAEPPKPYLNVMQTKYLPDLKSFFWISRHFPVIGNGQTDSPQFYAGVGHMEAKPSLSANKIYFKVTTNPGWIPTIGFEVATFTSNKLTLVVATNDNDNQKGKLIFYDFPIVNNELVVKDNPTAGLTLEDENWQALANFGNKIVSIDVNNDGSNDLLVTSPTSAWQDLYQVGHVDIFLHTNMDPYFKKESKITLRGKPVANSFFGWNAESVNDIDGDNIKDFIVAALKVSDTDTKGGIYIFFGSVDLLSELEYYEIIQPSTSTTSSTTGFGFFISMEWSLDTDTPKDLIISRVFDGAIDVYERTNHKRLKVTVNVKNNIKEIDENYFSSLWHGPHSFAVVEICLTHNESPLNAQIELTVTDSSDLHSFKEDSQLDSLKETVSIGVNRCHSAKVYIKPWFKELPLNWKLHGEVVIQSASTNVQDELPEDLFTKTIDSDITFRRKCTTPDSCLDPSFVMTSKDTAIWFQNGDEPISFNLQFQNNGDLLTHLIINVELSIPCEITIDDTVDVPYSELIAHSDNSVPSHARLLFPTPTLHNRRVDFTIRAKCQQILNKKVTPTLRLRIESFVPQYTNQFDFNAVSKMKSEFVIEVKKQPMKSIKVPMNTETEVDLNFDVALHIRGLSYDSELVYSAQLLLDDSIDIKVISLDISSPDCTISTVDDLTLDPRVMAQQKFKIAKEQRVEKVHLSVKTKVKFITSKDFQFTLKINPLVRDGADYSLESIFAYEMKHIFMIALGITRTNIAILVLATLGCFLLFTALFLLLHFMILPRFVVGNEEIGYIIDEVAVAEEY